MRKRNNPESTTKNARILRCQIDDRELGPDEKEGLCTKCAFITESGFNLAKKYRPEQIDALYVQRLAMRAKQSSVTVRPFRYGFPGIA